MIEGRALEEYRVVLEGGSVWLVRSDGTLVVMSGWRTCCSVCQDAAAATLANIATADWLTRRGS